MEKKTVYQELFELAGCAIDLLYNEGIWSLQDDNLQAYQERTKPAPVADIYEQMKWATVLSQKAAEIVSTYATPAPVNASLLELAIKAALEDFSERALEYMNH